MFYRIEVRHRKGFTTFKKDDVGKKGGLVRVCGKREDGKWVTIRWLVSKKDAHVDAERNLILDDPRVRAMLKNIRGRIVHVKGIIYVAKPRRILHDEPDTRLTLDKSDDTVAPEETQQTGD